jgi:hypothetical protein
MDYDDETIVKVHVAAQLAAAALEIAETEGMALYPLDRTRLFLQALWQEGYEVVPVVKP